MAVGGVAVGGGAVGYYAFGGGGAGVHGIISGQGDPEGLAFLEWLGSSWIYAAPVIAFGLPMLCMLLFFGSWSIYAYLPAATATSVDSKADSRRRGPRDSPPVSGPESMPTIVPSEPATPRPAKLSSGFLLRMLLLAAVAWLTMPLLFNAGRWGLAIAAFLIGMSIVVIARRAARFLPRTAERWRRRTPFWRVANVITGVVVGAGGAYFLFLGSMQAWDRLNWNFLALSGDEFRQEYRNGEYRLLRQLKGWGEKLPQAELQVSASSWSAGWTFMPSAPPAIGYFDKFGIISSLILGLLLVWAVYHPLLSDRHDQGMGWGSYGWPAIQLTMLTVAPALVMGFVLFLILPLSGRTMHGTAARNVQASDKLESVLSRLDRWVLVNDYAMGDRSAFEITQLPKGEKLARVELRHLWKPSLFERWEMTTSGLQRRAPDIAVELIGAESGDQTAISLRARVRQGDDAAAQAVLGSVDRLQEELLAADR
jgi:hypothetical protein